MIKKEDFYEDQIVVSLSKEGERRPQLYTVVEVHDSHMVLMSPWEGLDAVFYANPRTTYSPAAPAEIQRVIDDCYQASDKAQDEANRLTRQRMVYEKALNAINR